MAWMRNERTGSGTRLDLGDPGFPERRPPNRGRARSWPNLAVVFCLSSAVLGACRPPGPPPNGPHADATSALSRLAALARHADKGLVRRLSFQALSNLLSDQEFCELAREASRDPEVRAVAAEAVERCQGTEDDGPTLPSDHRSMVAVALDSTRAPSDRISAVGELSGVGCAVAVPDLQEVLARGDVTVQTATLSRLAEVAQRCSLEKAPLERQLQRYLAKEAVVQAAALRALLTLGARLPETERSAAVLLGSEDWQVRTGAAALLVKLGYRSPETTLALSSGLDDPWFGRDAAGALAGIPGGTCTVFAAALSPVPGRSAAAWGAVREGPGLVQGAGDDCRQVWRLLFVPELQRDVLELVDATYWLAEGSVERDRLVWGLEHLAERRRQQPPRGWSPICSTADLERRLAVSDAAPACAPAEDRPRALAREVYAGAPDGFEVSAVLRDACRECAMRTIAGSVLARAESGVLGGVLDAEQDASPWTRANVAGFGLWSGKLCDQAAVTRWASDGSAMLRATVVLSIAGCDDAALRETIVRRALEDPSPWVRAAAVENTAQLAQAMRASAVSRGFTDPSAVVRAAALRRAGSSALGLSSHGESALIAAASSTNTWERYSAAVAVQALSAGPVGRSALARLLGDGWPASGDSDAATVQILRTVTDLAAKPAADVSLPEPLSGLARVLASREPESVATAVAALEDPGADTAAISEAVRLGMGLDEPLVDAYLGGSVAAGSLLPELPSLSERSIVALGNALSGHERGRDALLLHGGPAACRFAAQIVEDSRRPALEFLDNCSSEGLWVNVQGGGRVAEASLVVLATRGGEERYRPALAEAARRPDLREEALAVAASAWKAPPDEVLLAALRSIPIEGCPPILPALAALLSRFSEETVLDLAAADPTSCVRLAGIALLAGRYGARPSVRQAASGGS
ncbi:MAG: hypothetical protein JW751_25120 [Polyangiaceae bacterium]|nr:hypothetical protein [Polyangiaceae bacterium]